jgi:hypothetical protein
MHQNGVALHAANGMLNKNTDLTQGCMGSLLIIAQVRVGVLFTRARLLRWDINPITTGVRSNTKIASIDPNVDICQPVQLRWELLFQHEVIVIVAAQRTPQKDDKLVRERHDRILQRMRNTAKVTLCLELGVPTISDAVDQIALGFVEGSGSARGTADDAQRRAASPPPRPPRGFDTSHRATWPL